MLRATSIGFVFLGLASCGSAPPEVKTAVQPAPTVNVLEAAMPAPSGTIHRSDVRQVMSAGLGTFLQRINFDVEHPVFRDHHFVGFRILELRGEGWSGIDLKPGDVITAVNGFSVERPEQAQQAFLSLAVASELRVDYERDTTADAGTLPQQRSMRLTITDD